jgi:glutaredoxin
VSRRAADGAADARVTLLGRAGCHLCDDARAELRRLGIPFVEVDVDTDPDLRAEHGEFVPVLLVDGRQLGYGRVDADRLRRALRRPAGRWRPW